MSDYTFNVLTDREYNVKEFAWLVAMCAHLDNYYHGNVLIMKNTADVCKLELLAICAGSLLSTSDGRYNVRIAAASQMDLVEIIKCISDKCPYLRLRTKPGNHKNDVYLSTAAYFTVHDPCFALFSSPVDFVNPCNYASFCFREHPIFVVDDDKLETLQAALSVQHIAYQVA